MLYYMLEKVTMKLKKIDIALYSFWIVLFTWLYSRVITVRYDGIYTAPLNNFGDLPFHLSIVTSFAYGSNFPPQNPIYAGIKFTYSFVIDLITSLFIKIGFGLQSAFFIENFALTLLLLILIYKLTIKLTRDKIAARIAPFIFFFNGGLGFINLFRDGFNLSKTFTMNSSMKFFGSDIPLRMGNVITTMLIPQRSLLLGLPLVAAIILFWKVSIDEPEKRRKCMIWAGVCAGILPLSHAHGFLAVMMVAPIMTLLFWYREWIWFYLISGVIASPQIWWLSSTGVKNKAFKFGWWAEYGNSNAILFWFANAVIFILLILFFYIFLTKSKKYDEKSFKEKTFLLYDERLFCLPFIVWFIVPNIISLAPWSWDNTKVLIYWLLAFSPIVAVVIVTLWMTKDRWLRILAVVFFIMLTLSGVLDVARALSSIEEVRLFTNEDIKVAEFLRENTPPKSVILHAPQHNSANALSGRLSYMGYPGHLWTHGIDYAKREMVAKVIYQGGGQAAAPISIAGINYIVIGPVERRTLNVNEQYFKEYYPVVFEYGDVRVFNTSSKK